MSVEIQVIDPVCGMEVIPGKEAAKSEFLGKTYYFCAVGCKKKFDSDPRKFLKKGEGDKK